MVLGGGKHRVFLPCHLDLNWIKYLNVRHKTIKLLEIHIGEKFLGMGLGKTFLDITSKAQTAKENNRQVGLY